MDTPRLPNRGTIRNILQLQKVTLWQQGHTPKGYRDTVKTQIAPCNRKLDPFIEGKAPRCAKFPRRLWQENAKGIWYNNRFQGDEEEIGNVESQGEEEEEEEDNHQ